MLYKANMTKPHLLGWVSLSLFLVTFTLLLLWISHFPFFPLPILLKFLSFLPFSLSLILYLKHLCSFLFFLSLNSFYKHLAFLLHFHLCICSSFFFSALILFFLSSFLCVSAAASLLLSASVPGGIQYKCFWFGARVKMHQTVTGVLYQHRHTHTPRCATCKGMHACIQQTGTVKMFTVGVNGMQEMKPEKRDNFIRDNLEGQWVTLL